MSDTFSGGCACGAIRFAVDATPAAMLHCQCRDCQHRSGAGHSAYVVFGSRAALRLTGKASEWDVTGESGTVKRHAFCPVCGAPVYLTFPAMPDLFIVHAAALDNPDRFQPQFVTYTKSGQAWDCMDPALHKFETMPPRTPA